MRLLLDTHVALWAIVGDARLPPKIQELIGDPANEVWVSAASIWEIAIKRGLARGRPSDMPISAEGALHWFRAAGYGLLAISPEHTAAVETLPSLHADPFDRLLVAQALIEPLRLISHDARVAAYGEMVLAF